MFTVFMLLALVASEAPARADIVGGEEVKESDPIRESTVSLFTPSRDGRGGSLCTASLIDNDVAVTAAHCIDPSAPNPVVVFGRDLRSPRSIKRPVIGARVHSTWRHHQGRGMDQGDIALVKFGGGLPRGYHKARVSGSESLFRKGRHVTLAGYGISDARARTGSGVLRRTQVTVANSRKGRSEVIFDQSRGHGACHGDSGGPAFITDRGKPALVGVTNRSYPDSAPDDCAHQVVYTKIGAYRDWIKKSKRELHAQPQLRAQHARLARAPRQPHAARNTFKHDRHRHSPRSRKELKHS